MGRGRAKAKQTKVARELKYNSPSTDFDQLQRELSGDPVGSSYNDSADDDPYAQWADEYSDDYSVDDDRR